MQTGNQRVTARYFPALLRTLGASAILCSVITSPVRQARAAESGLAAVATSDDQGMVHDIPLANGGHQRVLYLPAASRMRGAIVMFPGGAGDVGIKKNGDMEHGDNFVVRTRDLWRDKGYAVVIVDAIDHQSMRGVRSTPAYADIAGQVIAFTREQSQAPVWAMGTSQGSIAAMNAAATQGQALAGVILTESVSVLGGSHETVFDSHPERVGIPALVVANADDQCKVAPPAKAQEIARAMSHAQTTVLNVTGGTQRSREDCGSLTPHGYYGIERNVVDQIALWMSNVRTR